MQRRTYYDWPDPRSKHDASVMTDLENRIEDAIDMVGGVNVLNHGAIGDGVADDTAAIVAAVAEAAGGTVFFPKPASFYRTTAKITLPAGTTIAGEDGGDYWAPGDTKIIKNNGDTNGNCVFEVNAGCKFRNVAILAPDAPYFLAAVYPARPNNPSYGILPVGGLGVQGLEMDNCWVSYFKLAGIGGGTVGSPWQVPRIRTSYFVSNLYGIDWIANDPHITAGAIRHNVASGYRNGGAADTILGVRVEWNGRYGIQSSGRLVLTGGARIDRNGWAGVNMVNGAWGCILGDCEFYRNAAGGDSVYGKTAAVTTSATDPDGNVMYLAPPTEMDKAQITAEGVKYMISTGARLVAGQDDSGGGARSPKYAYALKNVSQVVIMNQDRLGWWYNTADLGSLGEYRDGTGARLHAEGSVAVGGIEWQDSTNIFAGSLVAGNGLYLGTASGPYFSRYDDGAALAKGALILDFTNIGGKLYFGSAVDTNLYRSAANTLKTDDTLTVGLDINARPGDAGQTSVGRGGPGNEAGIRLGTAGDTNLYRSGAASLKTDGNLEVVGYTYADNNVIGSQAVIAKYASAAQTVIGARGPGGEAGISFGSSDDTNLYRSAADTLRTDDQLQVALDIYARHGAGSSVQIGQSGPSNESGIKFGGDSTLYRNGSTAVTLRTDKPFTLPTYTTATKPAAGNVPGGTVIFVSDGGAGAVFQGSTGAAWVNLG